VTTRQPVGHIHFDMDGRGFDADDGRRKHMSEHTSR
jgi:hypothetical protein